MAESQTLYASGLSAAQSNSFTVSNIILDVGQISVANTIVSGGSGGPYSGQWTWLSSNQVNNPVVNSINVSLSPTSVAFNPSGTFAYVANFNSNNVSIINVAENVMIGNVIVGDNPYGVAVNPSGTLLYVTNTGDGTVSVINLITNEVVNTINVGSDPEGVAFSPSGTVAYVANNDSDTVSVISVSTNTVISTITVGTNPQSVAFNPTGTTVYVANNGSNTISVISVAQNSVTNTINVGSNPTSVAFSPSGTFAYVSNFGSNTVSVISVASNSVVNTIIVGLNPIYVAFNPSGTLAYVANNGSSTVSVISTASNTVINTFFIGFNSTSVAFSPSGTFAYVTNYYSNSGVENVSVVDVASSLATSSINTQASPINTYSPTSALAINPQGTLLYVTNYNANTANVVSLATNAIVNTIGVGSYPFYAIFNPSGSLAYILNFQSNTVSVVNVGTNTVVNTIYVGNGPRYEAFNPSGTFAYVTGSVHGITTGVFNTITVSSNSVTNTLIFQNDLLFGIAVNPSGTLVYVSSPEDNRLYAINTLTHSVVNSIYINNVQALSLAFNPSGNFLYAVDNANVGLAVVNAVTNSVVTQISFGMNPYDIALNPSGTIAYITDEETSIITVVDLMNDTIIDTLPAGIGQGDIAMNPSGTLAYFQETNISTGSKEVGIINNMPSSALQSLPYQGASASLKLLIDALSSNEISFTFNGITYYESTNTKSIYGKWNLYGFAQDNGTNLYYYGSNTVLLANTITIDPALVAGNIIMGISNGQAFGLSANPSGGTPSYSYQWYSGGSSTCTSDTEIPGATSSTYSASPSSSTYYCYEVTDSATTPESQYSNTILITPSPPTLSNAIIDLGQISVVNALISGGSNGPYSGQWTWINSNQVNGQVTNTVGIGGIQISVAFNPSGTLAYVANYAGAVNVIDVATNTVVNTIPMGPNPGSVAINPSGTLAYVAMQNSPGTVNVINTATNSVINTIIVGIYPNQVAFNPSGTLAYVVNYGSDTVNVINVATNSVINTIAVGSGPDSVAFNPSGSLAYVANYGSGTITVINVATNTVINTIISGSSYLPSVAFNPSGTLAYVANWDTGTINVINVASNSVINTIVVGGIASSVSFNPSGTLAYVATLGQGAGGSVNVIDVATNTVISAIHTGGVSPYAIAFNPSGTVAYVANFNSKTSNVISDIQESMLQELPPSGLMQLEINALNTNTLSFTFNGIAYTQSTGGNTVYGTWSLYGFAQDNGTNIYYYGSNTVLYSNTITINPALSATFAISNVPVSSGQAINFTANVIGGTGPFTMSLYNITGGRFQGSNVIIPQAGEGNVITLIAGASGAFSYNVVITDTGTTIPVVSNSVTASITVTGGNSGGGGGSGFSGGSPGSSGGSTFKPTVTQYANATSVCNYIVNLTQDSSAIATFYNQTLFIRQNFITPTTAGISIDNQTVSTLGIDSETNYTGTGPRYRIILDNISYIPIIQTTKISICTNAPAQTSSQHTFGSNFFGTVNVSVSNPAILNSSQLGIRVTVGTNSVTPVASTLRISGYMPYGLPIGLYDFGAVNLTASGNVTLSVIWTYQCASPGSSIAPYIYANSVWVKIPSYATGGSATACTIAFSVPTDPILALLSNSKPAGTSTVAMTVQSTSIPGTTMVTTAPANSLPATSTPQAQQSTSPYIYVPLALIVIGAIIVLAYLLKRRKEENEIIHDISAKVQPPPTQAPSPPPPQPVQGQSDYWQPSQPMQPQSPPSPPLPPPPPPQQPKDPNAPA